MNKFLRSKALALALALLGLLNLSAFAAEGDGFKNESEAGLVITSGNSESQSLSAKQQSSYTWGDNTAKFSASYLRSSSRGVESALYWTVGLRYERAFSHLLSGFLGQSVESDIYAGYKQRYNTDVGLKYHLIKEEDLKWLAEVGYRYMSENQVNGAKKTSHFARLYTEAERRWNESVSTKLWIEGLPNLNDSAAWQLNSELSLSAILTSVFSLKTAYLYKRNNKPAASAPKKTDTVLTTALVAKF